MEGCNLSICSRVKAAATREYFMIVDFRAFRKNSIKINGSIFFYTLCAKLHHIVASITYVKINEIGNDRLNIVGSGLHAIALKIILLSSWY